MNFRDLLRLAAPYRWSLAALGALTLGASLVMLAIPTLAGRMIGDIITHAGSTGRLLVLLIVALVGLALLNIAVSLVSATTSAQLLADLRVKIYEHLQRLPLAFHQGHRQGDTLSIATFEVSRLSYFFTETLANLPSRLLTVAGALILMLRIDRHLALLIPLLVPAFYIILKLVGRRLRSLAARLQCAEADIVALVEENLDMLPAIKSFTREEAEATRYRARVKKAMALWIQQGRISAALEPVISLVAAVAAIVLLYAGGLSVQSGKMTTGELFSFLFYAALLTRPVGALANVYGQVQTARGTLARLQSVLNCGFEPGYSATGAIERARGDISFEHVGFAYPGRGVTLDGVNLSIAAGETIGLVGSNGAGKTTLVNLLLRFHDPDRGTIRLDGRDVQELDVRQLRRQIGYVPQRALLFNGTIRDNIAYGTHQPSDAAVIAAARLSQAYDFIADLPDGFDTQIGDHGVRLSGGQRQRIALARALIKDPPILILDEATSMYDDEGERALIEVCAEALRGRTVLLITHRPASLAIAGRLLLVEGGSVSELKVSAKRARNGIS